MLDIYAACHGVQAKGGIIDATLTSPPDDVAVVCWVVRFGAWQSWMVEGSLGLKWRWRWVD